MRRFGEAGISPRTRHGQNFLIDLNLLRLLHRSAAVGPGDVVLEVGTGTGALTALLAEGAAHVITVELDPQLFQLASEELAGLPNVTMLRMDALRNKNNLNPLLLAAVKEQLAASPERRFKLAANLPYSVATPIITNALACEIPPHTMTVTIQKEPAGNTQLLAELLSEREIEVLRLMAEGYKYQEIAESLFVSINTVRHHTRHVYGKLNVNNRTQAIGKAKELNLL